LRQRKTSSGFEWFNDWRAIKRRALSLLHNYWPRSTGSFRPPGPAFVACFVCKEKFPNRDKLFEHVHEEKHFVSKERMTARNVGMIIGNDTLEPPKILIGFFKNPKQYKMTVLLHPFQPEVPKYN
jgi:hypothetical protein